MATSVDLVQSYYDTAQKLYQDLTDLKSKLAQADAVVAELQRQLKVHQANNDASDANIVSGQLATATGSRDVLQTQVTSKQAEYDAALKDYTNANATLLTADQKKQLADQQAAQQQIEKDQSAQALLDAQSKTFAQKNTQLVIGGGILLLVLGITFAFMHFKKAA